MEVTENAEWLKHPKWFIGSYNKQFSGFKNGLFRALAQFLCRTRLCPRPCVGFVLRLPSSMVVRVAKKATCYLFTNINFSLNVNVFLSL